MNNIFYLVRHGESKFNLENKHQGWIVGNPLTSTGLKQAKKVSNVFDNIPVDVIYSSPLLRTKQTAKIISRKTNIKVSYSKYLLDFRRSKSQEGLFVDEYTKLPNFKLWLENSNSNPDFSLPDGESRNTFSKRVNEFAKHCNGYFSNKKIIVVSHLDVLWQLITYWTNDAINKKDIPNCKIIKIIPDNKSTTFLKR